MEIILFTIVAIVVYLLSDWILQRIEISIGRRLEHRTLVFFALIAVIAVSTFSLLRSYLSAA